MDWYWIVAMVMGSVALYLASTFYCAWLSGKIERATFERRDAVGGMWLVYFIPVLGPLCLTIFGFSEGAWKISGGRFVRPWQAMWYRGFDGDGTYKD